MEVVLFSFLFSLQEPEYSQVKAAEVKEQLWLIRWTDRDVVGDNVFPTVVIYHLLLQAFFKKCEDLARPW